LLQTVEVVVLISESGLRPVPGLNLTDIFLKSDIHFDPHKQPIGFKSHESAFPSAKQQGPGWCKQPYEPVICSLVALMGPDPAQVHAYNTRRLRMPKIYRFFWEYGLRWIHERRRTGA
jgi:hypothetical protein